jgi:hypothetical protein
VKRWRRAAAMAMVRMHVKEGRGGMRTREKERG